MLVRLRHLLMCFDPADHIASEYKLFQTQIAPVNKSIEVLRQIVLWLSANMFPKSIHVAATTLQPPLNGTHDAHKQRSHD
jgi:hypothetical protein